MKSLNPPMQQCHWSVNQNEPCAETGSQLQIFRKCRDSKHKNFIVKLRKSQVNWPSIPTSDRQPVLYSVQKQKCTQQWPQEQISVHFLRQQLHNRINYKCLQSDQTLTLNPNRPDSSGFIRTVTRFWLATDSPWLSCWNTMQIRHHNQLSALLFELVT